MAKRSPLVCQHLENISRGALERHQDIVRQYVRGRQGVYALYRGDKLYYVGLASNLRMRLSHHMRNRHGESWDRFSVYLTIGDSHMRELEALILRIVKPKGNNQKGKFAKSEDIKRRFGRDVRERHRRDVDLLLGMPLRAAKVEKLSANRKVGVLVKSLRGKGIRLRRKYKGTLYKARVRPDGKVLFKGVIYPTPSAAGKALCGHAVNGWRFWDCERAPSEWVKLEKLRR
jgi:predicted GIY-YIG superfamily endonuclease